MPSDEVIEWRVTKLEGEFAAALVAINAKLDTLVKQPVCPDPGMCQLFKHESRVHTEEIKELDRRLSKVEVDILTARSTAKGAGIGARLMFHLLSATGGAGGLLAILKGFGVI